METRLEEHRSGSVRSRRARTRRATGGDKARRFLVALLLAAFAWIGAFQLAEPATAGTTPTNPVTADSVSPSATGSFPVLDLAPVDVALTIDGTPYPRAVIEGYLTFTRRQAAAAGDPRSFYEWGELLHLFDTATERVLAARAAWDMGFRVTADDLAQFSKYTLESTPSYLDEFYEGSYDLFQWDANLQILMKKWMAYVTHGARDVSWLQAGNLMSADEEEFAAWDSWYQPALRQARVVTYPERITRIGSAPPRTGLAILLLAGGGLVLLTLRAVGRGRRNDLLLRWPWLQAMVSRRLYPEGARAAVLAIFLLMLAALAVGSSLSHRNLGSVYLWILWWPLVPFLLFFSARSWCAVCPVATLGDMVQKVPGLGRKPAPGWLVVGGIWIIEGTFLAITWFDRSVGLVSSVRLTLTALLLLTGAALTVSALFRRRTFCRRLCFFGALAGNYSMASVLELRPRSAECMGCARAACLRTESAETAADGCPMLERPRSLAANRECNLCLTCLRSCERQSLALRVRDPLRELAQIRRPQVAVAGLAAVLVGVVAVQNLGMLEISGVLERRLGEITGLSRGPLVSLIYAAAFLLPLLLLFLAARGDRRAFAFFGYALIPLDLGAHAAHNLLHLLGEGKSVWWVTADLLGLRSPLDIPGGHPGGSMGAALLDASTIKVLQIALLLLAATASLMVARRLQRRLGREIGFSPLYGLLLLLVGVNLWMFSVPMALRH